MVRFPTFHRPEPEKARSHLTIRRCISPGKSVQLVPAQAGIFVSKHSVLHKYICICLYTLRPLCSPRLNIIEFSEVSESSVANFKVWSFEF